MFLFSYLTIMLIDKCKASMYLAEIFFSRIVFAESCMKDNKQMMRQNVL